MSNPQTTSNTLSILLRPLDDNASPTLDTSTEWQARHDDESEDSEEFVYPHPTSQPVNANTPPASRQVQPSPAQMESLYAAASSGDLPLLKRLFKNAVDNGEVEHFGLANHASTRTGFTALHAAASRGYYDMVVWRMYNIYHLSWHETHFYLAVIEECGAMPDLEDREGEVSQIIDILHLQGLIYE